MNIDQSRLPAWIESELGQTGARVVRELSGGNSNVTCLIETDQGRLVMRTPPGDTISPKAHKGVEREAIVMGALQEGMGTPLEHEPGQVEVDADGERMIVHAKEQLVLRCGKASITLTKAGKVLIQGEYVLSRSSGVNRVKGGSVQLN